MSELKYKLWDNELAEWCGADFMAVMPNGDIVTSMFDRNGILEVPTVHSRNADGVRKFSVVQWTSLKDKNGVEIYEGDILNLKWVDDGDAWERVEVIWSDAGFRMLFDYISYDPSHPILTDDSRLADIWDDTDVLGVEVIGNIYENPELTDEESPK